MMGEDSKVCRYCRKVFHRIDFPQDFDRMVTCGAVECMGKRRREMWSRRHSK